MKIRQRRTFLLRIFNLPTKLLMSKLTMLEAQISMRVVSRVPWEDLIELRNIRNFSCYKWTNSEVAFFKWLHILNRIILQCQSNPDVINRSQLRVLPFYKSIRIFSVKHPFGFIIRTCAGEHVLVTSSSLLEGVTDYYYCSFHIILLSSSFVICRRSLSFLQ